MNHRQQLALRIDRRPPLEVPEEVAAQLLPLLAELLLAVAKAEPKRGGSHERGRQ